MPPTTVMLSISMTPPSPRSREPSLPSTIRTSSRCLVGGRPAKYREAANAAAWRSRQRCTSGVCTRRVDEPVYVVGVDRYGSPAGDRRVEDFGGLVIVAAAAPKRDRPALRLLWRRRRSRWFRRHFDPACADVAEDSIGAVTCVGALPSFQLIVSAVWKGKAAAASMCAQTQQASPIPSPSASARPRDCWTQGQLSLSFGTPSLPQSA